MPRKKAKQRVSATKEGIAIKMDKY